MVVVISVVQRFCTPTNHCIKFLKDIFLFFMICFRFQLHVIAVTCFKLQLHMAAVTRMNIQKGHIHENGKDIDI